AVGADHFAFTDIAISPVGHRGYVVDSFNDAVHVFDTQTNSVFATVLTEVEGVPGKLAVAPDGSRLYVSQSNSAAGTVIDTSLIGTAMDPVIARPAYNDFLGNAGIVAGSSFTYVGLGD